VHVRGQPRVEDAYVAVEDQGAGRKAVAGVNLDVRLILTR
jgi:hypothetical protein